MTPEIRLFVSWLINLMLEANAAERALIFTILTEDLQLLLTNDPSKPNLLTQLKAFIQTVRYEQTSAYVRTKNDFLKLIWQKIDELKITTSQLNEKLDERRIAVGLRPKINSCFDLIIKSNKIDTILREKFKNKFKAGSTDEGAMYSKELTEILEALTEFEGTENQESKQKIKKEIDEVLLNPEIKISDVQVPSSVNLLKSIGWLWQRNMLTPGEQEIFVNDVLNLSDGSEIPIEIKQWLDAYKEAYYRFQLIWCVIGENEVFSLDKTYVKEAFAELEAKRRELYFAIGESTKGKRLESLGKNNSVFLTEAGLTNKMYQECLKSTLGIFDAVNQYYYDQAGENDNEVVNEKFKDYLKKLELNSECFDFPTRKSTLFDNDYGRDGTIQFKLIANGAVLGKMQNGSETAKSSSSASVDLGHFTEHNIIKTIASLFLNQASAADFTNFISEGKNVCVKGFSNIIPLHADAQVEFIKIDDNNYILKASYTAATFGSTDGEYFKQQGMSEPVYCIEYQVPIKLINITKGTNTVPQIKVKKDNIAVKLVIASPDRKMKLEVGAEYSFNKQEKEFLNNINIQTELNKNPQEAYKFLKSQLSKKNDFKDILVKGLNFYPDREAILLDKEIKELNKALNTLFVQQDSAYAQLYGKHPGTRIASLILNNKDILHKLEVRAIVAISSEHPQLLRELLQKTYWIGFKRYKVADKFSEQDVTHLLCSKVSEDVADIIFKSYLDKITPDTLAHVILNGSNELHNRVLSNSKLLDKFFTIQPSDMAKIISNHYAFFVQTTVIKKTFLEKNAKSYFSAVPGYAAAIDILKSFKQYVKKGGLVTMADTENLNKKISEINSETACILAGMYKDDKEARKIISSDPTLYNIIFKWKDSFKILFNCADDAQLLKKLAELEQNEQNKGYIDMFCKYNPDFSKKLSDLVPRLEKIEMIKANISEELNGLIKSNESVDKTVKAVLTEVDKDVTKEAVKNNFREKTSFNFYKQRLDIKESKQIGNDLQHGSENKKNDFKSKII